MLIETSSLYFFFLPISGIIIKLNKIFSLIKIYHTITLSAITTLWRKSKQMQIYIYTYIYIIYAILAEIKYLCNWFQLYMTSCFVEIPPICHLVKRIRALCSLVPE